MRPAWISEGSSLLDTHPRLMRIEIGRREEARVVGGDQRQLEAVGKRHSIRDIAVFTRATGAGDLEIEPARKALGPHLRALARLLDLTFLQQLSHFTMNATGQRDQPRAPGPRQPIELNMRNPLHLAFAVAAGQQRRKLAKSFPIHAQQYRARPHATFAQVANPEFRADDGLDPGPLRLLIELHRGKRVALIGQRHRRHARCANLGDKFWNTDQAIDQRVLGMQMQMDERRAHVRVPSQRGGAPSSPSPTQTATGRNERR